MSEQKPHVLTALGFGYGDVEWEIECPYTTEEDRPCRTMWQTYCEEGEADEFDECSEGGSYVEGVGHAHAGPECYIQHVLDKNGFGGVQWMAHKLPLALPMAVTIEDCDEGSVILAPVEGGCICEARELAAVTP